MNGQDVRGGNNEDMGDSEEGRRVETDHKIRKSKEILERTLGRWCLPTGLAASTFAASL